MTDTAKNLAFLSRRVSALEKKVQSLEANLVDSIVTQERLSDVVDSVADDLEHNTNLGHQMTSHFTQLHEAAHEALDALSMWQNVDVEEFKCKCHPQ